MHCVLVVRYQKKAERKERKIKNFWQLGLDFWVIKGEGIERKAGIRQKNSPFQGKKGAVVENKRK